MDVRLTLLDAAAAVVRALLASVLTAELDLTGVAAVTRDAVVLSDVLVLDVTRSALAAVDAETALPVLLAVAMPPLVDTLLVNVLSAPVLCLEPCQLSSFIGPMW